LETHDLAWAAGFFDGEGWANRQRRGAQSRINQAGLDGIPEVLTKFRRILGVGRIHGPVIVDGKQPLYYWEATSRPDLVRIVERIGPWLCPVKRAQFERTLGGPLPAQARLGSMSEELAWAGGLFDGEGSSYLTKHRTHTGYFNGAVEVRQSGLNGIPDVLDRFQLALGRIGRLNGPHNYDWAEAPVSRWRCEAQDDLQLVLHRLMPFIGTIKRKQAVRVLTAVNAQPNLPRGNPAFGVAGARFCLRGHDKWNARIRPFKGRGKNTEDPMNNLRQCLACVREDAQARRNEKRS
jgi:hypothetical protein